MEDDRDRAMEVTAKRGDLVGLRVSLEAVGNHQGVYWRTAQKAGRILDALPDEVEEAWECFRRVRKEQGQVDDDEELGEIVEEANEYLDDEVTLEIRLGDVDPIREKDLDRGLGNPSLGLDQMRTLQRFGVAEGLVPDELVEQETTENGGPPEDDDS